MLYQPNPDRYTQMQYRRCGQSGIELPAVSLGLWHNFGGVDAFENGRKMCQTAFDHGITHFDLANNYGPPAGSAEENFGRILKKDFGNHLRDELIISTKAGYYMWPGPYGNWGSKKYLISSLDQSLKRMGLDYVDIFYHHRPDPNTPLEETMATLDLIVRQGKALYVGISNYRPPQAKQAIEILNQLGTPLLIHQPRYHMFERWVEDGLLSLLASKGVGCIPFSPLAQGLLSNKYLNGIPADSRAAKENTFLKPDALTPQKLRAIESLNKIAEQRNQTLAQMALAWVLRRPEITTVLIGASKPQQITNSCGALNNLNFTENQLSQINKLIAPFNL